eukprot:gnl/Chilomastix_caulleri/1877.p2 GENE.gnl/Chilomastix_caulleri/1877~~gnl/Chilomastix_caulleri/1877.p2  ORF type:complete len:78 (+),score=20.55 gnl/Chilomastix_caulleri/1877:205-438(+)
MMKEKIADEEKQLREEEDLFAKNCQLERDLLAQILARQAADLKGREDTIAQDKAALAQRLESDAHMQRLVDRERQNI